MNTGAKSKTGYDVGYDWRRCFFPALPAPINDETEEETVFRKKKKKKCMLTEVKIVIPHILISKNVVSHCTIGKRDFFEILANNKHIRVTKVRERLLIILTVHVPWKFGEDQEIKKNGAKELYR